MITLMEAKMHCRVDAPDEDGLIQAYIDRAYAHFASIGIDTQADPLPPEIDQAALLLVTHWFVQRSAVTEDSQARPIPFGISRLIAPHREFPL